MEQESIKTITDSDSDLDSDSSTDSDLGTIGMTPLQLQMCFLPQYRLWCVVKTILSCRRLISVRPAFHIEFEHNKGLDSYAYNVCWGYPRDYVHTCFHFAMTEVTFERIDTGEVKICRYDNADEMAVLYDALMAASKYVSPTATTTRLQTTLPLLEHLVNYESTSVLGGGNL